MRPISNTYTVTDTDADGLCESQTPQAGGALTLNGVLIADGVFSIPTGQHITITSDGADTGRTFTVTGTDTSGNAITEAITGPGTGTVTSAKNFKTVTSVSVDDATAGAITVGVVATLETPWYPLNYHQHPFVYSYQVVIGTATFTLEGTLDNIQDDSITPVAFTVLASGTASAAGSSTVPARAMRLKLTAFTSGDITVKMLQSGY